MANKKKQVIPAELLDDPDVQARLLVAYEAQMDDAAGKLHNKFVAFISEAKVPLPLVVMVLQMLLAEAGEICQKHYIGGE